MVIAFRVNSFGPDKCRIYTDHSTQFDENVINKMENLSVVMDESVIPATLDFEKPGAYAFTRNPMLRYKALLSDDSYLTIALEELSENAQAPDQPGSFIVHCLI